jgi:hypothetical protein
LGDLAERRGPEIRTKLTRRRSGAGGCGCVTSGSGDFLLRSAGCQGEDLLAEAWQAAIAASCDCGGEHPAAHLAHFTGFLQADAYSGFAERLRQSELALEQARYEATHARRQYDAVDPDNRLVAGELERRWMNAWRQLRGSRSRSRACRTNSRPRCATTSARH